MITAKLHTILELKACYIKIEKVGEVYLSIESEHKQWAFDTIKATQIEIKKLKAILKLSTIPFTAMQHKPQNRI